MNIFDRLDGIDRVKFSFGKSDEFHPTFCSIVRANSMYDPGFGLGISRMLSPGNQILGVFTAMLRQQGIFAFNLSGVHIDSAVKGFVSYEEAAGMNMITEWELSIILSNKDYLKNTIFHNGKVEFSQNTKGIYRLWN